MLSSFRKHTKGWIAWAFVIVISVPFALWGIGQYRSLVTTDYVAKVNGTKIMPQQLLDAYNRAFQQRQTQLNGKFNPSPKQQLQLKMDTLRQLIDRTLLLQQAAADRMVADSQAVRSQIEQIPQFQNNGHFDYQQYKLILANNGLSPAQFENEIRTQIMTQQLQLGVAQTTLVTPRELNEMVALLREQRKASWFILPLKRFMPSVPPSATAIEAYYKAHQAQYATPETATIAYLQLNSKTLAQRVDITPEKLREYYRTHLSRYGTPPARKLAEILIKPAAAGSAAVAAAKSRAEKLLTRIESAKDKLTTFAELARKYSDAPISRRNGGSIGYVVPGQLARALDKAAFALSGEGAVAGPVHAKQGWVLLQLLAVRSGAVKPFDQVKSAVRKDYVADRTKALYYKLDNKFANLTYENSHSLEPAAKALGLEIDTINNVSRERGTGIAKNPLVRKAAFSDSVLKDHRNSNPVILGEQNAVVLRVSSITPSKVRPLNAVRKEIAGVLSRQQAREAVARAAAQALAQLRNGKPMTTVAKQMQAGMQGPQLIARAGSKLPQALTQAVFSLAPAANGKARYAATALPGGNQAVYALLGVKHGTTNKLKSTELSAYVFQLGQIYAAQTTREYVAWLRSKADIKIVKDNIQ